MAAALADVEGFRATFEMADEKLGVLDRLLDLLATGRSSGRQVHDANIVAVMLANGVRRLLTFNAADFRPFAGTIEILNPL